MMKYRKKPVEVEAMQLVGDAAETFKVCDWMAENDYQWLVGNALDPETLYDREKPLERPDKGIWIRPDDGALMIRTREGDMEAPYGWWIIKGVKGEFYSCRDDIFQETYEEVTPFDADGLAESIAYNKRVYDTFRGGEDGMLGVDKKIVHILRKKASMSTVKDYETIIRHAGEVLESIDQKFLALAEKGDWESADAEDYLELITIRQDMKNHISELKKDRKTARKIERIQRDHENLIEKESVRLMSEVWNLDRQGKLLNSAEFSFNAWVASENEKLQEEILELRY